MTDHYPVKQVIVIRKDLKMRRGKEIAQGAHASMAFLTKYARREIEYLSNAEWAWVQGSFAKICVTVNSAREMLDLADKAYMAGVRAELIMDDGKTEFDGRITMTALAIGPDYVEKINPITGHLPLY